LPEETKQDILTINNNPYYKKLGLSDEQWLTLTTEFENTFAAPLEEK
jgi:hypothetical protein